MRNTTSFVLIIINKQYLNEVLARRTRPPLDLWCFYVSKSITLRNLARLTLRARVPYRSSWIDLGMASKISWTSG